MQTGDKNKFARDVVSWQLLNSCVVCVCFPITSPSSIKFHQYQLAWMDNYNLPNWMQFLQSPVHVLNLPRFCFQFVTSIFTFYCSHVLAWCLYRHLLTKIARWIFTLFTFLANFQNLRHIEVDTRLESTTTIPLEVFKHLCEKGFFQKCASPWREGCWVIQRYIFFSSWVDVRIGGVFTLCGVVTQGEVRTGRFGEKTWTDIENS